jgi:hypothetical protein
MKAHYEVQKSREPHSLRKWLTSNIISGLKLTQGSAPSAEGMDLEEDCHEVVSDTVWQIKMEIK